MLMSLLKDEYVWDAFNMAVDRVPNTNSMHSEISKALVEEEKTMAPVSKFVTSKARNAVVVAALQSVTLAPSSPPSSPEEVFVSDEEQKLPELQVRIVQEKSLVVFRILRQRPLVRSPTN